MMIKQFFCTVTLSCLPLVGMSLPQKPIDLMSVYQQALTFAPSLKADKATQEATNSATGIGLGALLPKLDLNAQVAQNWVNSDSYHSNNFTFTLSQKLFDIASWHTWRNQRQTANAADSTYQFQFQTLMLTVATRYFAVLQAEDNLAFAKTKLEALTKTLNQTKLKFKVGVSTIVDVKQAEADYDQARAEVIQNSNAMNNARYQLQEITGLEYESLAPLKTHFALVMPEPNNIEHWVNKAKTNNQQLEAQRYTTRAARNNVAVKIGNQLPVVSIVGTYQQKNFGGNSNPAITNDHSTDVKVALQLAWNIFQTGGLLSQSIQAAHQYSASQANELALLRQITAKTRKDFLGVLADIKQVQALREAVKSSEINLRQTEERYKVGTETIVEVLNAVQQLFDSKSKFAQARYTYIIDLLTLKQDAGTITPADLAAVNGWLML